MSEHFHKVSDFMGSVGAVVGRGNLVKSCQKSEDVEQSHQFRTGRNQRDISSSIYDLEKPRLHGRVAATSQTSDLETRPSDSAMFETMGTGVAEKWHQVL